MLSVESKIIQKNLVGYRDDEFYGEKIRDLKDIMKHELTELCNVDILETMKKLYPEDTNFVNDSLLTAINNGDTTESIIDEIIENLISFIQKQLNTTEELKGIWVCATPQDVLKNYSDDAFNCFEHEETVSEEDDKKTLSKVIFDNGFFIVSDIEEQGSLIACRSFLMIEEEVE